MPWDTLDSLDTAILKSDVLTPTSIPADENGDGKYSAEELATLTAYWRHEVERAMKVRKGRESAWRAARRAYQVKQNRIYKTSLSNNKDVPEGYADPAMNPFRVSNAIFYSNVEIMASNIMAAEPVVKVTDNLDATSLAMAIQRMVQSKMSYFLKRIRLSKTLMAVVYDLLMFNIGIVKTGYSLHGTYMAAAPKNSPFAIRVSPFNFLADAEATDDDTARWMGEEYYIDQKELESGNYFNVKKAKEYLGEYLINPEGVNKDDKVASPQEAMAEEPSGASEIELAPTGKVDAASIKRLKLVDIYDKINRILITFVMSGNSLVCPIAISAIPSHVKGTPYKVCVLNVVPDNFYGVSDYEICEPKLREIDKIEQRILDFSKSLIPKYAFDESAVQPHQIEAFIRAEMLESIGINGQKVPIDKAILPIVNAVLPRENFMILTDLRNQINADLGITDFMRGKADSDTATEASIIDAASKTRSQKRQNRFDELLDDVVQAIYMAMREMQFEKIWINEPGMYPVLGTDPETGEMTFEVDETTGEVKHTWQQGFSLRKEMLKPFEITVEKGSTSAKKSAIERTTMLELFKITNGNPYLNGHAMLRQLFLAFGKNPEELVMSPDRMQQQQMTQAGGGMQGGTNAMPPTNEADAMGAMLGGVANKQLPNMPEGSAQSDTMGGQ